MALGCTGFLLVSTLVFARELATVEPLTTGPNFHWFGYYDKL
jgi:hypothetical protein